MLEVMQILMPTRLLMVEMQMQLTTNLSTIRVVEEM